MAVKRQWIAAATVDCAKMVKSAAPAANAPAVYVLGAFASLRRAAITFRMVTKPMWTAAGAVAAALRAGPVAWKTIAKAEFAQATSVRQPRVRTVFRMATKVMWTAAAAARPIAALARTACAAVTVTAI